jgi:hypothetical protein
VWIASRNEALAIWAWIWGLWGRQACTQCGPRLWRGTIGARLGRTSGAGSASNMERVPVVRIDLGALGAHRVRSMERQWSALHSTKNGAGSSSGCAPCARAGARSTRGARSILARRAVERAPIVGHSMEALGRNAHFRNENGAPPMGRPSKSAKTWRESMEVLSSMRLGDSELPSKPLDIPQLFGMLRFGFKLIYLLSRAPSAPQMRTSRGARGALLERAPLGGASSGAGERSGLRPTSFRGSALPVRSVAPKTVRAPKSVRDPTGGAHSRGTSAWSPLHSSGALQRRCMERAPRLERAPPGIHTARSRLPQAQRLSPAAMGGGALATAAKVTTSAPLRASTTCGQSPRQPVCPKTRGPLSYGGLRPTASWILDHNSGRRRPRLSAAVIRSPAALGRRCPPASCCPTLTRVTTRASRQPGPEWWGFRGKTHRDSPGS